METLSQTITVAVVCVSATVAWLSFWHTWKEKANERALTKLTALKKLKAELELIKNWAGSEYDGSSNQLRWYHPYWKINPMPRSQIKEFITVKDAILYGNRIFEALLPLEDAILKFYQLLYKHNQYLVSRGNDFVNHIVDKINNEMSLKGITDINNIDVLTMSKSNKLSPDEEIFVKRPYELQKSIHTDGIGTSADNTSLHSKFVKTHSVVSDNIRLVRGEVRIPFWGWFGHIAAVVFGILGFCFLVLFLFVFMAKFLWVIMYIIETCHTISAVV